MPVPCVSHALPLNGAFKRQAPVMTSRTAGPYQVCCYTLGHPQLQCAAPWVGMSAIPIDIRLRYRCGERRVLLAGNSPPHETICRKRMAHLCASATSLEVAAWLSRTT